MSEPNTGASTVLSTEASVTVDSQNGKPQPAAQNGAPQSSAEDKPAWLDARLERERSKILKDLGVESLDDAKKALLELNAQRDAQKSDAQRRVELEANLKTEKAEKQALSDALNIYAKAQMGALSEAQRNAVAAVAGDDPARQLQTIEALRPTWSAAAPAAPAAEEKPKDTAALPSAPKDGGSSSQPLDAKAVHAELKKANPVLAARYAIENGVFDQ